MAFPAVEATALTAGASAASHAVPLPATVSSNSLLVVTGRVAVAGAVAVTGGGWTIVQDSSDASDDVSFWMYRDTLADGTEDGTTVTVTHGTGKMSAISMSITGAENPATQAPESSTVAVGTGSNPGPTTCTPTGGAKDYLWIAVGHADGEHTSPPATIPANYGGSVGDGTGTGGLPATNTRTYIATRQLNAASEDPGTWTTSVAVQSGWTAWTLAVHPATSAPADVPLGTAAAAAAATLALTAATQIPLAASVATSSATLALAAPTQVPLDASSAVSSATLALTVPLSTGIGKVQLSPLSTPEAGTQTLRIRARAQSGAGILRTTLYDSDGTTVRGTDDFTLTGSFQTFELTPSGVTDWSALQVGFEGRSDTGLTAEVSWIELQVPIAAAGGPQDVPLQPSAAQSSASLALSAPTQIPLGTSAAVSSATLALSAKTTVVLQAAAAQSTASLALTATTTVPLDATAAASTGSLALTAETQIPLQASVALSNATLTVFTPTAALLVLGAATATSTGSLAVTVPPTGADRWRLTTDTPWGADSENRWPPATDQDWALAGSGRWPMDPEQNW